MALPQPLPRLCLGAPVDHQLEPLLGATLTAADPFIDSGNHAQLIENYGLSLQMEGRNDISENEIGFAKWLAMPVTRGGVVIALLQPARHQHYFSDHYETMRDCETLNAFDEVCRAITGYGLESISCFDAFPFHKTPVIKSIDKYEAYLDEAYDNFLQMIEQKQPDVVFCCYRSPHSTKYKHFQSIGIGGRRDYAVRYQGRRYNCVNGFHPSYALNHMEDKSALRTLFILEAVQAFRRANGTWRDEPWMKSVRDNCAGIVQDDYKDKRNEPSWTRHDFQRERFLAHMKTILEILDGLKSGLYLDMTNDELYQYALENRYNILLPNCLLLLVKISKFEDQGGSRLQERGFTVLQQREERDVRDLKRNVWKRCSELVLAFNSAPLPLQGIQGANGWISTDSLLKGLPRAAPLAPNRGFHEHFRHSFVELVMLINDAHICLGRDRYEIDRDRLTEAFRTAARLFEWAMGQHLASTRRATPEDDLSSHFSGLAIHNSPPQTRQWDRPTYTQTRTAPPPSSAPYPRSPPFTPPRRPQASSSSSWTSPPPAPQFGIPSPGRSPGPAPSTPQRSPYPCNNCKQTGHKSPQCPRAQCFRCKNFGHMSFDCPTSPPRPQYGH